MEIEEFCKKVEELTGGVFLHPHDLHWILRAKKITVSVNEKYLGGKFGVSIYHVCSAPIQPDAEDLDDAYARVVREYDRLENDFPAYEEYAKEALGKFEKNAKWGHAVACMENHAPCYRIFSTTFDKAAGSVQLLNINVNARGDDEIDGTNISVERFFGNSKPLERGLWALRCVQDKDGFWKLHVNSEHLDFLARLFKTEKVHVSMREFSISPMVTRSDSRLLPKLKPYTELLKEEHYTFIEFEVE